MPIDSEGPVEPNFSPLLLQEATGGKPFILITIDPSDGDELHIGMRVGGGVVGTDKDKIASVLLLVADELAPGSVTNLAADIAADTP